MCLPALTALRGLLLQHDAQMDYYGKRLATCSSDRTVKVFDVPSSGEPVHLVDLTGYAQPLSASPRYCAHIYIFMNILLKCWACRVLQARGPRVGSGVGSPQVWRAARFRVLR